MSRNLSDTVASVHLIQIFLIAGLGMSVEYCKAWDKFTGVKTKGLWED